MAPREKRDSPTPWVNSELPPCRDHEMRLDEHSERLIRLAEKLDKHDDRLNLGDVTFAEFRKDFHNLTASVTTLTNSIRWVGGLIVAAVVTALVSSVLK